MHIDLADTVVPQQQVDAVHSFLQSATHFVNGSTLPVLIGAQVSHAANVGGLFEPELRRGIRMAINLFTGISDALPGAS